ncbi:MAG: CDP-diacylglycerol--glycerol-3-phosphate 3-phosphatidyltransferase [Phycisphaerales bacterium]|nr:CDP-diacylglycerol--glycerol-3-phosphate 3-phosphatidyltransferase [Phycisphaerales bacterium]MCB9862334.1 CDP-diacylglycerol--glycerol-3-phosphate 3-phosphatidyltransferase [Phycisphaerales bacterium]
MTLEDHDDPPMRMNLPNQITTARLFLAIGFLILLGVFDWARQNEQIWLMDTAFVVFVVAGLSDILDGYLARKHNQITAFGRILDPFVDKVLVIGAFVMFLGSNFFDSSTGQSASGMEAWMVIIIIARELLVSGLRGFSESQGKSYAANWWGKIKMLLQSISIGWILTSLGRLSKYDWVIYWRGIVIYIMVFFTVVSVIAYLMASKDALSEQTRV